MYVNAHIALHPISLSSAVISESIRRLWFRFTKPRACANSVLWSTYALLFLRLHLEIQYERQHRVGSPDRTGAIFPTAAGHTARLPVLERR